MVNQDIIHLFHHLKSHLSTHDSLSFLQIVCSSYEQIRVVGYHPCDDEDILLVECGNSQIPDNKVDYLGDVEDEDLIFTAMIPFFSVIRQFSTDDDEKEIQPDVGQHHGLHAEAHQGHPKEHEAAMQDVAHPEEEGVDGVFADVLGLTQQPGTNDTDAAAIRIVHVFQGSTQNRIKL